MVFPRLAYEALESVVGADWVSDDPAVRQAYMRGGEGVNMWDRERRPPAVVVLPKNTKQVQGIIRVANRYKLPYVPMSTFMMAWCSPTKDRTIMIDPKRMDYMKIDSDNKIAEVSPYVTYANLQAECFKHGLYSTAPLCGSQASVLANHITFGVGQQCHRTGYGPRRLLGMEWVLPDGEILRTGSLTVPGAAAFCGEGPGPDLRGLVRGALGLIGGMGFITKIGIKLFAMPECRLEREGTSPYTALSMPREVIRWYIIFYDSVDACIDALYKFGEAEIGIAAMRVPYLWRSLRKAASRQEFFDLWHGEMDYVREQRPNVLRIGLCAFTSQKQLDYEERVLYDIANETGGRVKPGSSQRTSGDAFQNGTATCAYKATGNFMSQKLSFESIDHGKKQVMASIPLKYKRQKDFLIDDVEECGWVLSYDFGHLCHSEETTYFENTFEDGAKAVDHEVETVKYDLDHNSYPGLQYGWSHALLGPKLSNYHEILEKIQKSFDPNFLSNPSRLYVSRDEKEKNQDIYPYRREW